MHGGKREGAGRPKGIPNKATTEFKEKLNDLLEHAAPHMVKWLDDIAADDPVKAFDILSKFAEYVHPKLARTELSGIDGEPIDASIKVSFVDTDTKGV